MLLLRKIFAWLAPYNCLKCGREGSLVCAACLPVAVPPPAGERSPPLPLRKLWVGADYNGIIRQLLHIYKFERGRDAAELLGGVLARAAPRLPSNATITYVPTATSRVRQRGYDHARELARAFAASRGLVAQSLLCRHGQSRQMGADRRQRLQHAHAYVVHPGCHISGTKIIVVDDIITTGATLRAAAAALLAAGACEVNGLVVAQKE